MPPTPKQPNQPKHLPNTDSDDANMNKSLLATMFAGLGSVLLMVEEDYPINNHL